MTLMKQRRDLEDSEASTACTGCCCARTCSSLGLKVKSWQCPVPKAMQTCLEKGWKIVQSSKSLLVTDCDNDKKQTSKKKQKPSK